MFYLSSINRNNIQADLDEKIISSKYFVVECSVDSSKFEFIKHSVELFLETHCNKNGLDFAYVS